jgi:hypothetical protein
LVGDRYIDPVPKLATASFANFTFSETQSTGASLTGLEGGYEYLMYETSYEGTDIGSISSNPNSLNLNQFNFIAIQNLDTLEGLINSFSLKWLMGLYGSEPSNQTDLAKLGIQQIAEWLLPQGNKDDEKEELFIMLPSQLSGKGAFSGDGLQIVSIKKYLSLVDQKGVYPNTNNTVDILENLLCSLELKRDTDSLQTPPRRDTKVTINTFTFAEKSGLQRWQYQAIILNNDSGNSKDDRLIIQVKSKDYLSVLWKVPSETDDNFNLHFQLDELFDPNKIYYTLLGSKGSEEQSAGSTDTIYFPVYLLQKAGQLSVLNTGVQIANGIISFEISTPWIWSRSRGRGIYDSGNSIKLSSVQLALNAEAQQSAKDSSVYKDSDKLLVHNPDKLEPFYLGMVFKNTATISKNSFPPPLQSPYENDTDKDLYDTEINSYIVRDFLVEALLELPGTGSGLEKNTWHPVIMRATIGGDRHQHAQADIKSNSLQLDFYGISADMERKWVAKYGPSGQNLPDELKKIRLDELLSNQRAYINPYVNNQYVWTRIEEDLKTVEVFTDSQNNPVTTGTMYPPGNLECIKAADTATGKPEDGLNWQTQIEAANPARPYNKPGFPGGKPVLKDEFLVGDDEKKLEQLLKYLDKGEIPRVEVYGFRPMSQNPNGGADGVCPSIKIEYEIGTNANRPINGFPREKAPDITLDKTVADSEGKIYYLPTTTAKDGSAAADGDAFVYYSVSDKVAFSGEYFNFIESTIYPGGQRGWNGDYPGTQIPIQGGNPVSGWAKPVPTGTNGVIDAPWTVPQTDPDYFTEYIPPSATKLFTESRDGR